MIDPQRFRKNPHGKNAPIMFNIRLRRRGRVEPTGDEVIKVLRAIMQTGTVPEGWQLAVMDWRHPHKASQGWRSGTLHDFLNMAHIIEAALDSARIAIVRPDPTPMKKL